MYPLADGCFAPRNHWYVAAWSKDVERKPMERWILDEPVALYRRESGQPVALHGRCPHRSFPLGRSRVAGDHIVCGYHGIAFRPDGSCAEIPSQRAIPQACAVHAYPVVERWDWIWIWPGDPALADEALIPDHFALGATDPAFKTHSGWYALIPGRYMLMHDNLFDLTHLPHLHLDSLGGLSETKASRLDQGPGWVSSSFEYLDVDPPDYAVKVYRYRERVDRFASVRLLFPSMHLAVEEFRKASADPSVRGELIGGTRHFHAITPATRHSCHYFFAGASSASHPDPEFYRTSVTNVYPTLAEDISATRYIEEMIQGLGHAPSELLLRADAVCVAGRRMFEDAIRAEQAGERYPPPASAARASAAPARAATG
jgi:phenylpropionate dioxygenase-like ring-hydroxylating dioxygenase large terminal subunit